jgi:murein DD-endopeptidase MepM/ murein hydrolase activator NlpD
MPPEPDAGAAPEPVQLAQSTPAAVAPARPQPAVTGSAIAAPPARAGSKFLWPVNGTILSAYGPKEGGLHNDGINIAAARGTPVRAAENGVVAYVGNELRGFGNLVLVRHADGWVSAYAHADEILVRPGQQVNRGDVIARVGTSGGLRDPQVHFELRRGKRAVDPRKYLSVS